MYRYKFNVNTNTNKYRISFYIRYNGIYDGIDGNHIYKSKYYKIEKGDNFIILDDFPYNVKIDDNEGLQVRLKNNNDDNIIYYFKSLQLKSDNDLIIINEKNKYPRLQLNNGLPYARRIINDPCNII
jgi:hypothetical protein